MSSNILSLPCASRPAEEELVPLLNERAGLPQGTELVLYEEIMPNQAERLADLDRPLEKVSLV